MGTVIEKRSVPGALVQPAAVGDAPCDWVVVVSPSCEGRRLWLTRRFRESSVLSRRWFGPRRTLKRVTIMLNSRLPRLCLALIFGACCAASASAQEQSLSWAEQMFDQRNIDFGVVARGSDAVARVKVTNKWNRAIHIADVKTTCGCSAGKPSKTSLESLEEGYIEVTMDTRKFTRRKDSNLIITFDTPWAAEVRIPITAYIRTDVVFDPGSVNFGAVEYGKEATRTIKLQYAGRSEWQIKEIKSRNELVVAKAVETARGNGRVDYDITVTLAPNTPPGAVREQLTLITDDQNSPQVPLLVEAAVEADVTVTPAIVSLGLLKPGESKQFNIVIKGRQPIQIDKVECESENGLFKVRLPQAAAQVHSLPMTITAPDKPGDLSEEFTITINGRPTPVTFKARGKISEPAG